VNDTHLRLIIRTPHEVLFDGAVRSVRVRTDTGHVGIRHRMEPVVLPIEAGLVIARTDRGVELVGSAGGLLVWDGSEATLFTPLGVAGTDPTVIQQELDRALAEPGSELAVRATFGKLERRILTELRQRTGDRPEGGRR
jgi:F0F1-type ATP synthase epsilon subunit